MTTRYGHRSVGVALLLLAVLPSCAPTRSAARSTGTESDHRPLTFAQGGQSFNAVLELPSPDHRNGWGILLLGGGMSNDLDWTVPGEVTAEGTRTQLTITGASHADAPTISRALAARGFAVLRWSTIPIGDPLAAEWPMRTTPRSLVELCDDARAALQTLRSSGVVDEGKALLLGHSLGAVRACTIAADDRDVRGLVLLASAYFTSSTGAPASLRAAGLRFGDEVVRARSLPCLAVFGALDSSRAVRAAAAADLAGSPGLERLEVRVIDGLGHQLGRQQGTLVGPIDAALLVEIAAWAHQLTAMP